MLPYSMALLFPRGFPPRRELCLLLLLAVFLDCDAFNPLVDTTDLDLRVHCLSSFVKEPKT
jgi:hypothetical protein